MRILAWSPVWLPLLLIESWATWEIWLRSSGADLGFGSGAPGAIHFLAILVIFFTCIALGLWAGRGSYLLARHWDKKLDEAEERGRMKYGGAPNYSELARRAEQMDSINRGS